CAVVLPTVPIHAIEANKLTITTRLILRYSYIPIIVTYRAHASAVKPRIGPHQGRTRAVEAISLADNAKPSDGLSCRKMKPSSSWSKSVNDSQAIALHQAVDKIMRRFKLEPGMLAGNAYADLHVNDVGLLAILAEPGDWNVRKITQALSAPFSTVSSALDRLEVRKLVGRRRRPGDRRVVYIELTPAGTHLAKKLRTTQIETCRAMLARLSALDRDEFIRLVAQVAQG